MPSTAFRDYYKTLEISADTAQEEIRTAYKKLAMRWHPDRNPAMDTTSKMQSLNEAYLILGDARTRERYDQECRRFRQWTLHAQERPEPEPFHRGEDSEAHFKYADYTVHDDELRDWMNQAARRSGDLGNQIIEDAKGMLVEAGKTALINASSGLVLVAALSIVPVLVVKGCD